MRQKLALTIQEKALSVSKPTSCCYASAYHLITALQTIQVKASVVKSHDDAPLTAHGNSNRRPVLFDSIEKAVKAIASGSMVVVLDDEHRENEGDLIMAAEYATPESIAFFVKHTSGVICVALPAERLSALDLPLMVTENNESMGTAFTVTTDYRHGTSTGISAADRALTIRALVNKSAVASDFVKPGHVFPLRSVPGGILQRQGHTEATVELTRLAGCSIGGVLCELVNEDGSMSRRDQLRQFAEHHGLPIISIADLVSHVKRSEMAVIRKSSARVPTGHGQFTAYCFESTTGDREHVAFVMGDFADRENVLVRVHSECLTGDVFGSLRCDCGAQLDVALRMIASEGCGIVVYMKGHEGRGIGLTHKMLAYRLQDSGRDTVEANLELGLPVDTRDYSAAAQIVADLGVRSIRLMSNSPSKFKALADAGVQITSRVPLLAELNDENRGYLQTKQSKLGHWLGMKASACRVSSLDEAVSHAV